MIHEKGSVSRRGRRGSMQVMKRLALYLSRKRLKSIPALISEESVNEGKPIHELHKESKNSLEDLRSFTACYQRDELCTSLNEAHRKRKECEEALKYAASLINGTD